MNATDTPQQARLLRSKSGKTARKVRQMFPVGARVTSSHPDNLDAKTQGTVTRHVPGRDAQGGYLVVDWDNGTTGRHTAISLRVVAPNV